MTHSRPGAESLTHRALLESPKLIEEFGQLVTTLKSVEQLWHASESNVARLQAELAEAKRGHEAARADEARALADLRAQLATVKRAHAADVAAARKAIEQGNAKLAAAGEEAHRRGQASVAVAAELERTRAEATALQARLAAAAVEIENARRDLDAAAASTAERRAVEERKLAEAEEARKAALAEADRLRARGDQLSADVIRLDEQRKATEALLDAAKAEGAKQAQQLRDQLLTVRADAQAAVQAGLEPLRHAAAKLEKERDAARAALEAARAEIAQLHQRRIAARHELDSACAEVAQLLERADRARADVERGRGEADEVRQGLRAASAEAQALRVELEATRARLEDATRERDADRERARAEAVALKSELDAATKRLADATREHGDAREEMRRLRGEIEHATASRRQQDAQNVELRAELQRQREVYPLKDLLVEKDKQITAVERGLDDIPREHPRRGEAEASLASLRDDRARIQRLLVDAAAKDPSAPTPPTRRAGEAHPRN